MHPISASPINFDDLDDTSLVPSGKSARELKGEHAKTSVAAGISMGTGRSVERNVNQVAMFKCDKCHGSGRFISYAGRDCGECRKCKGTGKLKTDPAKAAARKRAAQLAQQSRMLAWIEAHQAEWDWMQRKHLKFGFAKAMLDVVTAKGELTAGQLTAVRNCIAKEAERNTAYAARKPDVDVAGAGFDRMLDAFAAAKAARLKNPKMRIAEYRFSLAKETSANSGCLYVKRGETYIGKITKAGGFFAGRDATAQDKVEVARIGADPLAAAVAHGKQTGQCACCGRELENAESVALGIGPICREKWGL